MVMRCARRRPCPPATAASKTPICVALLAVLIGAASAQFVGFGTNSNYKGIAPGGQVMYETVEDAPTFTGQLPPIDFSDVYRASCFPKKANYFRLYEDGRFEYRGAPNQFSRGPSDQDVWSFNGLVDFDFAMSRPGEFDCNNLEDGMCKTNIVLVNVFIQGVNDAPLANNGETTLPYVLEDDIVEMNSVADPVERLSLDPPFALVRPLVGTDVDGDRLTYSISQQPKHGSAVIVENNIFKYVPDAEYIGEDTFEYMVDDCLGGGHTNAPNVPCLSDTAFVLVQVSGVPGLPSVQDALLKSLEDEPVLHFFTRGAYSGPSIDNIRFRVVDRPESGRVEVLCFGAEVYDPETCSTKLNVTLGEDGQPLTAEEAAAQAQASGEPLPQRRAWFLYTPALNYYGNDTFSFDLFIEGEEDQYDPLVPATLTVQIGAVNDPPAVRSLNLTSSMGYPEGHPLAGNITVQEVEFQAVDIDSNVTWLRFTRAAKLPERANQTQLLGRFFRALDADGVPFDEITVPGHPDQMALGPLIPMEDGRVVLYYTPPPAARGDPMEQFTLRATDGTANSPPVTIGVSIKCREGFFKGEEGEDDEFLCYECPPGSVSRFEDSMVCTACQPGTASPGGLATCEYCPAGSYATEVAAANCTSCPAFATSQPGSIVRGECYCREGFFGDDGQECQECPRAGRRNANAGLSGDQEPSWSYCNIEGLRWPLPQQGFYIGLEGDGVAVRECMPPDACVPLEDPASAGRVARGETCSPGYGGIACATCEEGFFRMEGDCRECPSDEVFPLVLLGFLVVLFLPILLKLTPSFVHHFAAIDIALSYTQVSGLLGTFSIPWPSVIQKWFRISSAFNMNFELLHLECNYSWDFKKKWTLQMCVPIIILVALMFLNVFSFFLAYVRRTIGDMLRGGHPRAADIANSWVGRKLLGANSGVAVNLLDKDEYRRIAFHAVRGYLTFLHMAYVFLCLGTFEMFDCLKDGASGRSFLEAAPDIECYTSEGVWGELIPWAVLCIFLYPVGIWCVFAYMLHYHRNRLEKLRTQDLLGFCINQYKPDSFYYEAVLLGRLLLLSVCTMINGDASAGGALRQAVVGLVILLVAQGIKASWRPFRSPRLDLMEAVSLVSNFWTLLMGITFISTTTTPAFRDTLERVNVIIILGTYVFFGICIILQFMPWIVDRAIDLKYSRERAKALAAAGVAGVAGVGHRLSTVARSSNAGSHGAAGAPAAEDPSYKAVATAGGASLPEEFRRFLRPQAMAALNGVPASEGRVSDVNGVFKDLGDNHTVQEEMWNQDVHAEFKSYMKPRMAEAMLTRIAWRSRKKNQSAMEFIEAVMALDVEDRYLEKYAEAKVAKVDGAIEGFSWDDELGVDGLMMGNGGAVGGGTEEFEGDGALGDDGPEYTAFGFKAEGGSPGANGTKGSNGAH